MSCGLSRGLVKAVVSSEPQNEWKTSRDELSNHLINEYLDTKKLTVTNGKCY